jgi:hypothetical protein
MSWTELDHASRAPLPVSSERERELDKAKEDAIPKVAGEVEKPFTVLEFQPVISPGIYDGEFALKGKDIIFHFWPYGYEQAVRDGKPRPSFPSTFKLCLEKAMAEAFTKERFEMSFDRDVGSWFVKALGWGDTLFGRELAIKACERVHFDLGGV